MQIPPAPFLLKTHGMRKTPEPLSFAPWSDVTPPPESPDAMTRPRRLLLAEDDSALRFMLASALRQDGYQVVAVANGVDLMDLLFDSLRRDGAVARFDLVLSDLRMPGWPGLESLAEIRRHRGVPPMILFTAFGDEATHRRAREIGAVTLFDKPFDLDELRETVAKSLR